jgi:retinol dehydrogenase-14
MATPPARGMHGKTVLITGGGSGLGKVAATGLARMGATVVIAVRDERRGAQALDELRASGGRDGHLLAADLASLASVRSAAEAFGQRFGALDVLINNAAINLPTRQETRDGFELHFGVNYLAHYLLTRLLTDRLVNAAPARVVNVGARQMGATIDLDDLQFERDWDRNRSVYRAKTAMFLFTRELARRLADQHVTANVVDPGLVKTPYHQQSSRTLRLIVQLLGKRSEQAGAALVHLASAPELAEVTGQFFAGTKPRPFRGQALDDEVAARLWKRSAALVGLPDEASAGP